MNTVEHDAKVNPAGLAAAMVGLAADLGAKIAMGGCRGGRRLGIEAAR